ncbi:hypothetical protein [Sporomusa aerivorans]|uniref:hypothetical protein n=1 Tax=Sporomusa aerivorans TaxID=204936 RepID=UPI00352BB9C0
MDILQTAYNDYLKHLFSIFVGEVVTGQDIEDAAMRFKTGVETATKVLNKAKEIISNI